jgi:hypothetical protein
MDHPERLDGWKAIAGHLGRDVRTAQRWQRERRLPVHHVPGRKSGGVFALASELDAWLLQPAGPDDAAARQRSDSSGAASSTGPEPPPSGSIDTRGPGTLSDTTAEQAHISRLRRARWLIAAPAAVIALTLLVGVGIGRSRTVRPLMPAQIDINGSTLIARTAEDSVLWSYRLDDPLRGSLDGNRGSFTLQGVVGLQQQDSDIVVLVSIEDSSGRRGFLRSDIYRFSRDGTLRWRYAPDFTLVFGNRAFTGPWRLRAWAPPNRRGELWLSFIDPIWWPSIVVSLMADGAPAMRFASAGHVETITHVEDSRGNLVIVGGVNNEFRSAALAVLDPASPASSPQSPGSAFSCDGCPAGQPLKYFLFPRSEVGSALGAPYNFADGIMFAGDPRAGMDVSVRERDMQGGTLRSVYHFGADLTPASVARSDRYWEEHRRLSDERRLPHQVEGCPERHNGTVVRIWTVGPAWRSVPVLPTFPPERPVSSATAVRK